MKGAGFYLEVFQVLNAPSAVGDFYTLTDMMHSAAQGVIAGMNLNAVTLIANSALADLKRRIWGSMSQTTIILTGRDSF